MESSFWVFGNKPGNFACVFWKSVKWFQGRGWASRDAASADLENIRAKILDLKPFIQQVVIGTVSLPGTVLGVGDTVKNTAKSLPLRSFYSSAASFPTGVPQQVYWCVARIFKTCNTWLFSQGHWPLFPFRAVQPRMAMNAAQPKIINLLNPLFFFCSSVFVGVCVFNMWLKTTLLPV